MDYNKILQKAKIEESKDNVRYQEDKYCEAVINMLEIMDETQQIEIINNMTQPMKEATLKKQALKMNKQLQNASVSIEKLENAVKTNRKSTPENIKKLLGKIEPIKAKIKETLDILNQDGFKAWYTSIDNNTGVFGFTKKNAVGPSRRTLGL